MLDILVLGVLPGLAIAAAIWDVTSFSIPNFLQVLLIVGFVVLAIAAHLSLSVVGFHLLAALIGFGVGLALFALGYIGGGDAKLFVTLLLWLGLHDLVAFTLVTAIFGGGVTLIILAMRRFALPGFMLNQAWILRLHDPKGGIPYGVALACGLFAVLPQSEIFRLATSV
ncbi:MAG TPA: prepilin peptidase [Rhizomicrobium sp.]|jgi:prepilin peptidase CpaA|nr:prepilin peptidase [Rhizomicrobium sp.]